MCSPAALILACIAAHVADGGLLVSDYEDVLNNRQTGEEEPNPYDLLPGDYPTFKTIPRTSFSCQGKLHWHYYADIDAGCQAFHVCETEYSKISFLCPIGSVFNQLHLVCDWWYNVDCSDSFYLYPLRQGVADDFSKISEEPADLSLASSGGNTGPKGSTSKPQQHTKDGRRKKQ